MAIAVEPTSKFAQAGDLKIHYVEAGTGDPVICIHGGGPGASGWSNFKQNLPALSEHFRTMLIDLPQFGQSDKPVIEGSRLAFWARTMRDFLDALGIEKAHFVGNSMGGGTSMKTAIDYPDRVDRLVLMGAAGHPNSLFTPSPTEGIRSLRTYYDDPSPERMRNLIRLFVSNQSRITDELVKERYDASVQPEILDLVRRERAAGGGAGAENLTADLARIRARTLMIWGADDRFVPLDAGLVFLRNIKGSQLHVFSDCGHWAQAEHPEEFDRLVIDFLTH
jgi:pimeloyl-ACP methyl ester carboxylesterase